jgi:hypothetical protein
MSYLSDAFDAVFSGPVPWSPFGVPIRGAKAQPVDPNATDQATAVIRPSARRVDPSDETGGPDMIARYPDGMPILDRNGNPMQKPPFADLGLAVQRGQEISGQWLPQRLFTLYGWLQQGGDMDYHRPPGHETDPIRPYRDVSNYVVGAVPAAAGIPKWMSDLAGTVYTWKTSDAPAGRDQRMWDLGRSDYLNNLLSFSGVQPAGPPMVYPPPPGQNPDDAVSFPGLQPLGRPTIYAPPTPDDIARWPTPSS